MYRRNAKTFKSMFGWVKDSRISVRAANIPEAGILLFLRSTQVLPETDENQCMLLLGNRLCITGNYRFLSWTAVWRTWTEHKSTCWNPIRVTARMTVDCIFHRTSQCTLPILVARFCRMCASIFKTSRKLDAGSAEKRTLEQHRYWFREALEEVHDCTSRIGWWEVRYKKRTRYELQSILVIAVD